MLLTADSDYLLTEYSHNKGMDHSSLFQILLPAQFGIEKKNLI